MPAELKTLQSIPSLRADFAEIFNLPVTVTPGGASSSLVCMGAPVTRIGALLPMGSTYQRPLGIFPLTAQEGWLMKYGGNPALDMCGFTQNEQEKGGGGSPGRLGVFCAAAVLEDSRQGPARARSRPRGRSRGYPAQIFVQDSRTIENNPLTRGVCRVRGVRL